MLEKYLSSELSDAINKIPYKSLNELRLRSNNPAMVNVMGENFYLHKNNYGRNCNDAIYVSSGIVNGIVQRIANNSIYTINDQLIDGYVCIDGGIRVGVCGEVVTIDGNIRTLKNISSLNFRFPHFVKNCSLNIFKFLFKGRNICNTLIVSPPGAGKTTMIRDIIYQLSIGDTLYNVLVVDERKEIISVFNGVDMINLNNIDVYSNSTKKYAFNNGIRSMKPDVIITDEINIDRDIEDIENAITSGVSVIATIHASSVFDLKSKSQFKNILCKKLFDRYIFLSCEDGVGTLEGVFDENLNFLGV